MLKINFQINFDYMDSYLWRYSARDNQVKFFTKYINCWNKIGSTKKVEQILRSWELDADLANIDVRVRECSWPSVCSSFCERTKFCWTLLCSTFYVFALFGIHCYSKVPADFKGNLATLKLGSVMKYVGHETEMQGLKCDRDLGTSLWS